MDTIGINLLLEYIYNKFIVTFIICLMGAVARETMNTIRLNRIEVEKMLVSAVVSSVAMCAILDYISLSFSIYAIVCVVMGIWSKTLLNMIMNSKLMVRILCSVAGNVKDPMVKGIAKAIEEMPPDDADTNDHTKSTPENDEKKDIKTE